MNDLLFSVWLIVISKMYKTNITICITYSKNVKVCKRVKCVKVRNFRIYDLYVKDAIHTSNTG